ncbi:MAG: lysophospholipase [Firmicutes bacterium]|nr:lysophospholipase [Bacillota bacterium]
MIKTVIGSAYFARTNEFKIYNRQAKPGGVVFVGDSLTQRYPLSEFYPGVHLYNRGIDGDTTEGLSKRLNLSIFDLKPNVVVMQIGTNDLQVLGLPKEKTVENIASLITSIRQELPKIQILLLSLYPVNESTDKLVNKFIVGPRKNTDIQWINDHIRTFKGVEFVDVYPSLLDEDGQLKMQYSKEGLHLSLAGYAVVTEVVKPRLMTLL